MSRIYFRASVEELTALVLKHRDEPAILGPIHDELTYRETERAVQLRREVRGLLDGQVPQPAPPPRPASPADQTNLF